MNTVYIDGDVGKLINFHQSGSRAILNFCIAKDRVGRDPDWFDIVVFDKDAERLYSNLVPGMKVSITGELRTRRFSDTQGNRIKIEIAAQRVDCISRPIRQYQEEAI